MATDNSASSNRARLIGSAIEDGADETDVRRQIASGEIIFPTAGATFGGFAAATGLGGVGLVFGGSAIGIGAVGAVAAPAIAAGAVTYGVYRAARGLANRSRGQVLRGIIEYFRADGQPQNAQRVFSIEGMGQLDPGRRPPTRNSASATLRLLDQTESRADMGVFCSPRGELVLTYDLAEKHWAYVMVINSRDFTGAGFDPRGRTFTIDDIDTLDLLIRVLEREEILTRRSD